jgi:hypothetical protein
VVQVERVFSMEYVWKKLPSLAVDRPSTISGRWRTVPTEENKDRIEELIQNGATN